MYQEISAFVFSTMKQQTGSNTEERRSANRDKRFTASLAMNSPVCPTHKHFTCVRAAHRKQVEVFLSGVQVHAHTAVFSPGQQYSAMYVYVSSSLVHSNFKFFTTET